MKASDIADNVVLASVAFTRRSWGVSLLSDVVEHVQLFYPDAPVKVVLAKLRKLARRGLIDGCICGCRGDFSLTELGERVP